MSQSVTSESGFVCTECTFMNPSSRLSTCEMCHHPKPSQSIPKTIPKPSAPISNEGALNASLSRVTKKQLAKTILIIGYLSRQSGSIHVPLDLMKLFCAFFMHLYSFTIFDKSLISEGCFKISPDGSQIISFGKNSPYTRVMSRTPLSSIKFAITCPSIQSNSVLYVGVATLTTTWVGVSGWDAEWHLTSCGDVIFETEEGSQKIGDGPILKDGDTLGVSRIDGKLEFEVNGKSILVINLNDPRFKQYFHGRDTRLYPSVTFTPKDHASFQIISI